MRWNKLREDTAGGLGKSISQLPGEADGGSWVAGSGMREPGSGTVRRAPQVW